MADAGRAAYDTNGAPFFCNADTQQDAADSPCRFHSQLLLRALPPELVLNILQLAEYHTPVNVVSDARKSVANGSLRYLSSQPLPHTGRLEEVRIALSGRDQGWSSFPELHGRSSLSWPAARDLSSRTTDDCPFSSSGTYEGSSSYYELYLLRQIQATPANGGDSPRGRTTRSNPWTYSASSAMDDGPAEGDRVEVEVSGSRRTLQYNVHA